MRRALRVTHPARGAILFLFFFLFLFTRVADSTDSPAATLQDHEKRIATQEERSRKQEIEINKLDEWYDSRINNMEKYYNAKIEQQQKTDTELLSFLEAAKTFLAFAAGVVSLFFGYIGIRNIITRGKK